MLHLPAFGFLRRLLDAAQKMLLEHVRWETRREVVVPAIIVVKIALLWVELDDLGSHWPVLASQLEVRIYVARDDRTIAALERLLEGARSGKIIAIAMVAVLDDGDLLTGVEAPSRELVSSLREGLDVLARRLDGERFPPQSHN